MHNYSIETNINSIKYFPKSNVVIDLIDYMLKQFCPMGESNTSDMMCNRTLLNPTTIKPNAICSKQPVKTRNMSKGYKCPCCGLIGASTNGC